MVLRKLNLRAISTRKSNQLIFLLLLKIIQTEGNEKNDLAKISQNNMKFKKLFIRQTDRILELQNGNKINYSLIES